MIGLVVIKPKKERKKLQTSDMYCIDIITRCASLSITISIITVLITAIISGQNSVKDGEMGVPGLKRQTRECLPSLC